MFRPGGVLVVSNGVAEVHNDTVTCAHCHKICERKHVPFKRGIHIDDPDDIGGVCGGCGRLICYECAGKRECTPIEKRLDIYERKMNAINFESTSSFAWSFDTNIKSQSNRNSDSSFS